MNDSEVKTILDALKQGKMVIVKGVSESKVQITAPQDKVVVIVRE
ncbi:MAG: hypothetical protein QXI12_05190 [Candidatus Methanomethyliaceae archaeon]